MRTLILLAALAASFAVVGCKSEASAVDQAVGTDWYRENRYRMFKKCEGAKGQDPGFIRLIERNAKAFSETYRCYDGSILTMPYEPNR